MAPLKITVQLAMTGEKLIELELETTDTLLTLREGIRTSTVVKEPFRVIFKAHPLTGQDTLESAGLASGDVVDVLQQGIPGWTRLCHADHTSQETTGDYLVWDVPPSEVPALAARASRLRIQQRDAPEMAVESRPECYPIQNLRRGEPIGFGLGPSRQEIQESWTTPEGATAELIPDRLWHTKHHWLRRDHDKLAKKIYHCCDNGDGIHWDENFSSWTVGGDEDLELYIDVP